ncbi:MAG: hypothetical protein WC209_03225 [Ignavibacteriaceae bacterium]
MKNLFIYLPKQTKAFIDAISRGLSDSEKDGLLTTSQLRKELQKNREKTIKVNRLKEAK